MYDNTDDLKKEDFFKKNKPGYLRPDWWLFAFALVPPAGMLYAALHDITWAKYGWLIIPVEFLYALAVVGGIAFALIALVSSDPPFGGDRRTCRPDPSRPIGDTRPLLPVSPVGMSAWEIKQGFVFEQGRELVH